MMYRECIIICLLFCLLTSVGFAQTGAEVSTKDKAEMFFEAERYNEALPLLLQYQASKPKDMLTKHRIGVCYFNANMPDEATQYFALILDGKKPIPESYYYMARIYHLQNKFDKAMEFYKAYLPYAKSGELKIEVKNEIRRCVEAKKVIYKERIALVENMGEEINSIYDEFAPVVHSKEYNTLYFTSVREGAIGGRLNENDMKDAIQGRFRSDMYKADLRGGEWLTPTLLNSNYNTKAHEELMGFSDDANLIYYRQSRRADNSRGEFFKAEFPVPDSLEAGIEKIASPFKVNGWNGNLCWFNDSTLIMSSTRDGGYGGKDLYICKQINGEWLKPVNLGPIINSPYDEVCPFLANNGRTLYYSSNNLKSMGGLDVFKTEFVDSMKTWTVPDNLGMPINSSGDDSHFILSRDGLRAYFASARLESLGQRDIFVAYFKENQEEQIAYKSALTFMDVLLKDKVNDGNFSVENINELPPIPVDPVNEVPEERMTLTISPLYYKDDNILSIPATQKQLVDLARVAREYPSMVIELGCHNAEGQESNFELYFALKRLYPLAEQLVKNGVSADQILLKGFGRKYPIAKNFQDDGSPHNIGRSLNNRIEVKVYNVKSLPVDVEEIRPQITDLVEDRKAKNFEATIKDLSYRVQLKKLKSNYDDPILNSRKGAIIEQFFNSDYMMYTLGTYKRFYEAESARKALLSQGYTDVKVIPYINGLRLDEMPKVRDYASAYPDLVNYVRAIEQEVEKEGEVKKE